MIITIKSENPQFSYLIKKNPVSPPRIVDCRQGYLFGWFPSDGMYAIRFIDAADEVSFKDYAGQEFEYLSSSKYSHPLIPPKAIGSFFNKLSEDDSADFKSELTVSSVYVGTTNKIDRNISKYFPGVELTPVEGTSEDPHYYSVKITQTTGTLQNLLETAEVFFIYIAILDYEDIDYGADASMKWFKKLAALDAPYFVRYKFKNLFVKDSKRRMEPIKNLLNQSNTNMFNFSHLSNETARIEFLKPHFKGRIFDVGCGEGSYVKKFAGKPEVSEYICVDTDPVAIDACKRIAQSRNLEIIPFNCAEDVPAELYCGTVILSEVLEHIESDKINEFLQNCRKLAGENGKVVLTTPNRLFNVNYLIDRRRDDHVNEMDRNELLSLLDINNLKVTDFTEIGDIVDGEPTTFGVVCVVK